MNRFHAPEDSVTEQSVRMAHNYEYMVPVETAWELEQAFTTWRQMAVTLYEAMHGPVEQKRNAIDRFCDLMIREAQAEMEVEQ